MNPSFDHGCGSPARAGRQPHEASMRGRFMRPIAFATGERNEGALTAVIEFLSAFTLFLMILTAFISLAQLQMGSNDPEVDRLDRAAALGLDRPHLRRRLVRSHGR